MRCLPFTKKMRKLWKKNFRKDRPLRKFNKEKNHNKEVGEANKRPIAYYECKRQRHVKAKCPQLKRQPQKNFFRKKKRSMMAT